MFWPHRRANLQPAVDFGLVQRGVAADLADVTRLKVYLAEYPVAAITDRMSIESDIDEPPIHGRKVKLRRVKPYLLLLLKVKRPYKSEIPEIQQFVLARRTYTVASPERVAHFGRVAQTLEDEKVRLFDAAIPGRFSAIALSPSAKSIPNTSLVQ